MNSNILDVIDFGKVDTLLEGFNKSTGFVTAILDLEGKVLSKSGWRQMCTEFHRINPETSKRCSISDTILAGKLAKGKKYHFYKCLNGLVDVAVPIIINGEHIANLFSGQFFFEEPDISIFRKQAKEFGFDVKKYLKALESVPVVSKEKVKTAMDFLLNMTQLISEMTFQKLEQIKMNKNIEESEEKFKSVFESANVGNSITLPTGEINVNDTFCKMLGYTREELKNKKWQELTPENEISDIQKILEPLLKGEKDSARFNKRYICKNGSYIWADVSTSILRDDLGKPLHFITTAIDITERKLAEEERRLSEELFSNAFHFGPAGMTITRISDGKFIDANESFCKMFEFDRDEVIGHTSTELKMWSPEERKRLIKQQHASGGLHNFELVAQSKFGQPINILFSSRQVELGGEACHITTMIDITDRKQAEEALREREYLFSSSQRAAHIGTWSWKVGDTKIFWSDETFRIYGLHPDIGQPDFDFFFEIIHPDDRLKMKEWPAEVIAGLKPPPVEFRVLRSDGIYRVIQTEGDVIETLDGVPTRIVGTAYDITERRQTEEALKKSEQDFRNLSESMPQIVWVTRADGWNIYFNRQWMDYTGMALEESYGHGWNKPFHPDDRQRAWDAWQNAVKNNGVYSLEVRLRRFDGEYRWWLIRGVPFVDEKGEIQKWFGTCTDIEEIKQAEKNLAESEKKYRMLFEYAPYGIVISDPQFVYTDVNENICRMLGFSKEELIGLHASNIVVPKEVPRISDDLYNEVKRDTEYKDEWLFKRKDGSTFTAEVNAATMPDGSPMGVINDITERKRAEESIRTRSERLKILHKIDQAILGAIDSPEKITQEAILHIRELLHYQRATVGIFDFEKKEIRVFAANGITGQVEQIGRNLSEGIYGDVEILRQNKLEVVEDNSKMAITPNLIKTIQAEEIHSFINAPIVSSEGLIGVLSVGWDKPRTITTEEQEIVSEVAGQISIAIEQARLIKETKRHAEELEEKVLIRTAQLEISNKELEAFSYSVSHDLRAPLRHINGYIDMLNDRFSNALPDKAKYYLATVSDSARQMGILIDDLLQFSRTGRQELVQVELDMNVLVQGIVEKLKIDTKSRRITWSVSELPWIYGDYSLLKQVWINLLENAVKYTRNKKDAKIEIGYRKDQANCVFYVRDNGVGFDMQYAHKLFGVFQRLHSQSEFEGTGIGLANVQRIIIKHGGRVWADAKPDKGATFFFSLPNIKEV